MVLENWPWQCTVEIVCVDDLISLLASDAKLSAGELAYFRAQALAVCPQPSREADLERMGSAQRRFCSRMGPGLAAIAQEDMSFNNGDAISRA